MTLVIVNELFNVLVLRRNLKHHNNLKIFNYGY